MGWQFIAVRMGMRIVTRGKHRLVLRMMRCLGVRVVEGMVLVEFAVPVFVRAGPGLG